MTETLTSAALASHDDVPSLAARVDQLSGEGALDVFRRAMELERAGRSIVHLELGGAAKHIERALAGELIDARRERRNIVARCARSGRRRGRNSLRHVRLREGS